MTDVPQVAGLFFHERSTPGRCSLRGCDNRGPDCRCYGLRGARLTVVVLCPVHYGTVNPRRPATVLIEPLTEEEAIMADVMEG